LAPAISRLERPAKTLPQTFEYEVLEHGVHVEEQGRDGVRAFLEFDGQLAQDQR
jgi:hypothetical protein